MQKIFIVEDDDNIREMLSYAFSSSGFISECFSNGEELNSRLVNERPHLILLDIMLPGVDGISLLKGLKNSSSSVSIPVIMLSAKGAEIDRIKGLELGADDYITKPFSVLEVISRVKAVLRRCSFEINEQKILRIGNVSLDKEKRIVKVDNNEIALTYREFELLCYLMINEGIVLSREKLLQDVWGYDYCGESRTVDMHIKSLRQKLDDGAQIIKTIRNVGYKIGG